MAISYAVLHNLFSFCSLVSLGYVDIKQKGLGPSYYNKSMCAIMDVIHALNSNRSFISYRAHKVARILQDSLCKTSGAVLICCLVRIPGICILYDFVLEVLKINSEVLVVAIASFYFLFFCWLSKHVLKWKLTQ